MVDTNYFTECVVSGKPVCFVKYGDGEYECAIGKQGHNCDGDRYLPELREKLKESFVKLCQTPNTYIGQWHLSDKYISDFFETLHPNPPWVNFHCLLRDQERAASPDLLNLVKAIRDSPKKKIYVSNISNARMSKIFKSENVIVPNNTWFNHYEFIMNILKPMCDPDSIVIFSSGLCSKVAIADLVETFPEITCFDFGSSFDLLSRGVQTRSYQGSFEDEVNYYKDILPENWVEET
jgi:hypothetical protein